jgi:hypothetical protein
MFKVAIASAFLLLNSTVTVQAGIISGIGCNRKIVCRDTENCKAKISYWIGNSLTVGAFKFFPEQETKLNLNDVTGEITVVNKVSNSSLGTVDLNTLNCMEQEADYKNFVLNIPDITNIALKETEHSSICNSVWNGEDWIFVRDAKYSLFLNGNKSPAFSTSTETVSCF